MKANSNTRMKMSIAKALDTTRGSASTITASAPSHSQRGRRRFRITASTRRTGRSGEDASVSSSIRNTTIRPESAPTN